MTEQAFKVSNTSFHYPESMDGKIIIVDKHFSLKETKVTDIKDVTFVFEKEGSITIEGCSLKNCNFSGLHDFNSYSEHEGFLYWKNAKK